MPKEMEKRGVFLLLFSWLFKWLGTGSRENLIFNTVAPDLSAFRLKIKLERF